MNCDLTDSRFDDAFFLYPLHPYSGMMAERFEINQWSYYENVKSGYIGFDGCTFSEAQMRQTKNWKRKDLRGISLRNMNLVGWDFSGVDMRRANLGGSSLNRVNFTDTNIQGLTLNRCTGLTLQQLQESNTLRTTSDTDVLHIYFNADFDGLTDEQRALQDSLRERWGRR